MVPNRATHYIIANAFKKLYVEGTLLKTVKKPLLDFFYRTCSFFEEIMMKNKRGRELVNIPFSGCQICAAVFLLIHYLVIFDALIQRGF